jgi:mono/diheme cytochrome c family protein
MPVNSILRTIPLFALLAATPALADDFKSLPEGPGRDVMVRVCSQCHSPEVAAQQRLDPTGWKALVDQMANNGAQASDAEFNTITQYLATSFPPK